MDEELRKKIEAALFSVGKKINIKDIMRMIKEKDKGKVAACLIELKNKYSEDNNNSLVILQDGEDWKLTIKDQYIEVAKEIGIETELSKTIMETLAVIAYKNPVLQSQVIKTRTNKAYEHLSELETLGYITREKNGRTKLIKLAPKFFEYFDLPPEVLKEKFKTVEDMEKVIEDKEKRIHEINEDKKQKIEARNAEDIEIEKKNPYMEPRITEVTEESKSGMIVIKEEMLGNLEIIDEDIPVNNNEEDINKKNLTQQDNKHNNDSNLMLTGKKVGEFEVYSEPDNYIEPGLSLEKKDSTNTNETPNENPIIESIEATEKKNDTEDEISKLQELKEKINIKIKADKVAVGLKENDIEKNDKPKYDGNLNENEENQVNNKNNEVNPGQIEEMKDNNRNIKKNNPDTNTGQEISNSLNEKEIETVIDIEESDISKKTNENNHKRMKEEHLFETDGLPKDIEDKIEAKAEEILGEK